MARHGFLQSPCLDRAPLAVLAKQAYLTPQPTQREQEDPGDPDRDDRRPGRLEGAGVSAEYQEERDIRDDHGRARDDRGEPGHAAFGPAERFGHLVDSNDTGRHGEWSRAGAARPPAG